MELVFLYINQTSSKFIEKQGFNFSANFSFYVDYVDGKYVLGQKKCTNQLPVNFFDEQGCITNITAIVGENGAGKTTLLNEIQDYSANVRKEKYNVEYEEFFSEKYEEKKRIAIYLEQSKLICYHNIENFQNQARVEVHYLSQGSEELKEIVGNSKAFEGISKICLSNSMYATADAVSTYQRIRKISLNPNSLHTLKRIFFNKKCKKISSCVGGYFEIQDIICSSKTITDFQQILDILYLQYLEEKCIVSVLGDKFVDTLNIKFCNIRKYIDERYNNVVSNENSECGLAKSYDIFLEQYLSKFDMDLQKLDIFVVIYLNLLYELMLYCRKDDAKEIYVIKNKKELISYLKNNIDVLERKQKSSAVVFKQAMQEIQEYEKALADCKMFNCLLPISDTGYISYKQVKYGSKEYRSFLNLVKKSVFEREHSYVLKYLDISGLQLASGERALLNLFSWLYLVPYFNYISNDVKESLQDNVLLLIDEIDLYCHPLWQQKLLSYLIKEVKTQYYDKKVQIIFTTHSPIVLSDMPQSNIIFLRRKNDKCSIDEENEHTQTFGANIYKLFDDAFFLGEKGQIGEFSREKIQGIIDKIKPQMSNEEPVYPALADIQISLLEQQIALIGENIIRNKLYEMLYKCKYRTLNQREQTIKIYEEKIKRLQNGEEK